MVRVIFKTDTHDIISAIQQLMTTLPTEHEVQLQTVRAGVGLITEADVKLAEGTRAHIFSFNMRHPSSIDKLARRK